MKRLLLSSIALGMLPASSVWAGEGADDKGDLKAAAKKLVDQPNYSFTTNVEIKKVGTTTVEAPEEAKKMLEQTSPCFLAHSTFFAATPSARPPFSLFPAGSTPSSTARALVIPRAPGRSFALPAL